MKSWLGFLLTVAAFFVIIVYAGFCLYEVFMKGTWNVKIVTNDADNIDVVPTV